jgi:ectoine hydroxylase-related dioxygenase (phytanoyl-CoA dioxygenase family)
MKVNPEDIEFYRQNGAIVIRGLCTATEISLLQQGIARNMAEPSPLAIVASAPDDPGYFIEDFCNWQRITEYRQFIQNSNIGAAAGQLMGSQQVRLYHDHLLVKEPKTLAKTPWHQDQPYYNIDGEMNCSMWFPVDPVSESATLRFVAGSHKQGWLMPRSFMSNEAKWFPEGTLKDLPDIDGNPDKFKILAWALEPGDAVFFHMLTLHGAGGVGSGQRRRVLSVRFMGDDIVHAPRPWRTSPPFPGLTDQLPAGAKMHHPLFPILWER